MNFHLRLLILSIALAAFCNHATADPAEILNSANIPGGLVVHLGCGDGSETGDYLAGEGFRVHGLDASAKNVSKARSRFLKSGDYGPIAIDQLRAKSLPYANNLVNLLVAESGDLTTDAEILRVLVPEGQAWIRDGDQWRQLKKERPDSMDDWQHYLRSPDNNPVSTDSMIGPPNQIQWMATPKFSRAHEQQASFSAAVSDGGLMFYILDDAPRVDIRLPSEWYVIARDGFNGVELWRRRMGDWVNQFRRFRAGPASLPFRLVAAEGKVFVTMDFTDPVSVLDAATGETIRTIPGSEKTKQIMYEDGVLTLLIDEEVDQHDEIDAARRRGEFMPHHCKIMKALVYSGEVLWEHKIDELVFPCLALKNGKVFGQTPDRVFSMDWETGEEAWSAEFSAELPVSKGKLATGEMQWESPSIVVNDSVVLAADFKKVHAYDVNGGELKWEGKSKQEYNAPPDLMLVGEDLWMRGNGSRVAINPSSGEVKTEIQTSKPYMHPRCYRGKAVGDFMLFGEMGVQMVNSVTGDVQENDWIRGTCQFGVMPANGLLYVPPDSCACNMKSKLSGLYAFASSATATSGSGDGKAARFEKGPAFESIGKGEGSGGEADWPTFRGSAGRTGISSTVVPSGLSQAWKVEIGGELTSPVVAEGNFYVAAKDQHTIHALDAGTGEAQWTYTAGGRIDSPPTIFEGAVYFGSTDGWVYAVNAQDGELAWRFRAAPEERLVSIRGQLESAWPVHGSVLIQNGELVCSAGRSSYLDGGIRLYKLDPATGERLEESTIWSPDETGKQDVPTPENKKDVHGVLSDVLVADGGELYMRHLKLDFETADESGTGVHLFSPLGLLDDTWWHRAYWMVNDKFQSHWSGWWKEGNKVASGRILSYDTDQIYGFGRDKYPGGNTGQWRGGEKYQLFAYDRGEEPPQEVIDRKGKKVKEPAQPTVEYRWTTDVPLLATALVATPDAVFIAGPPDGFSALGEGEEALELKNVESALGAWRGEDGGILYAADAVSGKELAHIKLSSPTVFDGMAAANESLFLSLQDGSVVCLEGSEL